MTHPFPHVRSIWINACFTLVAALSFTATTNSEWRHSTVTHSLRYKNSPGPCSGTPEGLAEAQAKYPNFFPGRQLGDATGSPRVFFCAHSQVIHHSLENASALLGKSRVAEQHDASASTCSKVLQTCKLLVFVCVVCVRVSWA